MIEWNVIWDWLSYDPQKPLLFNSEAFLYLFLAFFFIYILLKDVRRLRILYVIAFSLFFYYKCSGIYFLLLIFSSFVDFYISDLIYKSKKTGTRKWLLVLSCVINLGVLAYFKYTGFLTENFNALFSGDLSFDTIFLPIGISFYTFQTMSYTIDIYRRELEPARNVWDFMFFVSFFPQLVAGPIVRAKDFIPQIYEKLYLTKKELSYAFYLIIGGLIKKAVISDYISVNFVDRVFNFPDNYTAFENLLAVYGYTLQIYCDFSGYSDIAIGLALLLGFQLPPNFRTPYQSISVTEFWRRWHISLSGWLRDYLYISMGGNRKGKLRTYFNLFMTMLLGGLWHGASWKFVLWGAMHGSVLAVEKAFNIPKWTSKNIALKLIAGILTFHFVAFCWIFFRASDFTNALNIIDNIGMLEWSPQNWWSVIAGYQNVAIIMLIGFLWHFIPQKWQDQQLLNFHRIPVVGKVVLFAATIWIISATASSEVQPFIYFQF
ncbi:D-alanyl-lipoteichoic acid acyltransferase DltB (MBOAT superfamily) [Nonlabens dokdonensis]|jgi:D-alanyl-lipoteichoic acid acyltransferase DltB (MBOAT superfamily)|uniref:Alginate O-acetylation protein n=2 Tax=Nonlabens dokdonensis TaxID=328515 RepID=L7W911_NONDD|nr:MBOAT family O-acyltransferase [Nonlabens dokdonensis]AGC76654.1 alginate O-acetylation protein [Nonlabens dokdonensis DSW-6]PZX44304.1 D-alanyl-lipoteichoic acid acyltransferase DltB (MBOAT superfamily) [Nonlabens dokdonensis]